MSKHGILSDLKGMIREYESVLKKQQSKSLIPWARSYVELGKVKEHIKELDDGVSRAKERFLVKHCNSRSSAVRPIPRRYARSYAKFGIPVPSQRASRIQRAFKRAFLSCAKMSIACSLPQLWGQNRNQILRTCQRQPLAFAKTDR